MEDRRLTRKGPISIYAGSIDQNIEVKALPWRERNDLGELIREEFLSALDKIKKQASEGKGTSSLESQLDYERVAKKGLPGTDISSLEWDELIALMEVMCDLNGLTESCLWMLDPNVLRPQLLLEAEGTMEVDGQKMQSTEDSSEQESIPEPSTY